MDEKWTQQGRHGQKRFHLVLPESIYSRVSEEAAARGMTVVGLLRNYIKLGLMVTALEGRDGAMLLIREKDEAGVVTERQLVMAD